MHNTPLWLSSPVRPGKLLYFSGTKGKAFSKNTVRSECAVACPRVRSPLRVRLHNPLLSVRVRGALYLILGSQVKNKKNGIDRNSDYGYILILSCRLHYTLNIYIYYNTVYSHGPCLLHQRLFHWSSGGALSPKLSGGLPIAHRRSPPPFAGSSRSAPRARGVCVTWLFRLSPSHKLWRRADAC